MAVGRLIAVDRKSRAIKKSCPSICRAPNYAEDEGAFKRGCDNLMIANCGELPHGVGGGVGATAAPKTDDFCP